MDESGFPIERRALRELVRVRAQLDQLERALVARARRSGHPWREIGEDLGITLQSAWSRHAGSDLPRRRRRPSDAQRLAADLRTVAELMRGWRDDEPSAPPEGSEPSARSEGSDPFSSR